MSPWILGKRGDLALLFGGCAFSAALAAAGRIGGALAWVFLLFQAGFNLPHYFQTFTLTYLDGASRKRHGKRLALLAAVAVGLPLAALLAPSPIPLRALTTVTLLWGFWHIASQTWGLAALYLRRAGVASEAGRFWARAALLSGCAFPLAFRLAHGGFGYAAGSLAQESLLPRLPGAAASAVAALWTIAALGYGAWVGARLKRREPWGPLAAGLVALTVAQFCVGLLFIDDFVLALVFLTTWHAVQYLALVFQVQRRRQGFWPRLASKEEVGYFTVAVVFALAATFAAEALPRPWGDAIYLPLLMAHYLNDGWLWKRSVNPPVAGWLAAGAGTPSEDPLSRAR